MLKLYGGARSRASIVQWYLEELNVPYEFVMLDMQAGEHHQPDFLAINPMGKVPAIVDGDFTLWESGAILLYLAEKHGQLPDALDARAVLTQWVMFANATLGPEIFSEASREQQAPKLLGGLDQVLDQKTFITGEQFTVADVAVGAVLAYIPMMLQLDMSPYPQVQAYIQRLGNRPAFQKILGKRGS